MKAIATTGTVWGQWTVLARADRGRVKARCSCGVEKTVLAGNLTKGISKSCGCRVGKPDMGRRRGTGKKSAAGPSAKAGCKPRKSKFEIGLGQRFTNWLVVGVPEVGEWVEVRCDCGKESRRRRIDLLQGNTKSCGCARNDNFVNAFKAKDARVARAKRLLAEVLTTPEQAQVNRILDSRKRFGMSGQEIKLEAIEVVVADRGLGWLLCHGGLEELC